MKKKNKLTKKEKEEIIAEAQEEVWHTFWNTIYIIIATIFIVYCVGFTFGTHTGVIDLNEDERDRFCNDLDKIKFKLVQYEYSDSFLIKTKESEKLLNMYIDYCIREDY